MKKGNFPNGFDLDLKPVRDFVGKLDSMFQQSFKHLNDHLHLKSSFQVEVKETEKNFLVFAELPGYAPNQIELEISGNQLRITVDKDDKNHSYQKQQAYQRLERVVSIPIIIPPKDTTASFENGLLTVTIPKKNTDRTFIDLD